MKKRKLHLKTKMLLYIIGSSFVIYFLAIGIIIYNVSNDSTKKTYNIARLTAEKYSAQIKSQIDSYFYICKTLANIGLTYDKDNFDQWNKLFLKQEKKIIENDSSILSVGTSFQLNKIDSSYTASHGRYLCGYFREGGSLKYFDKQKDLENDNISTAYYKIRTEKISWISDPEFYAYTKGGKKYLNVNVGFPMIENNEFVGLPGIDVDMGKYSSINDSIKPFPGSFSYILSYGGVIVAGPNKQDIGKSIVQVDSAFTVNNNIIKVIQDGKYLEKERTDSSSNIDYVSIYSPIKLAAGRSWSLLLNIPKDIITKQVVAMIRMGIISGIIGLILIIIVIVFIATTISRPIRSATNILNSLSKGRVNTDLELNEESNVELELMSNAINKLTFGLDNAINFASEVGKNNLELEYNKLSDQDRLGTALIDMRDNLKKAKEEEELRNKESEIRRWKADGLGELNNILRKKGSLSELGYQMLRYIINYVKASMGAFYIINDNDPNDIYFEMFATLAYERKKLMRDKVRFEEGLVGRCAYEKMTIHLREIPENYIKIRSGLGEGNPRSLLIVPLLENGEVVGVMEIVSFNLFEEYEIEFLEQAGVGIANQIATIRVNERTSQLLRKSQEQADILAQQEEEVRQNMEEIQATQEQFRESQARTQMIFDNIHDAIVMIDKKGTIEMFNPSAVQLFGYESNEALGKNVSMLMRKEEAAGHDGFIKRYLEGGKGKMVGKTTPIKGVNKSGELMNLEIHIRRGDINGETKFIAAIWSMEAFIQERKKIDLKFEKLEAVKSKLAVENQLLNSLVDGVKDVTLFVEYNKEREIVDINDNFIKLLNTSRDEMLGVKQGAFEIDPEKQKEFDELWNLLEKGKTSKMFQHIYVNGKDIYFSEVYIPMMDENNEINRVINLAIDITDSINQ